MLILVRNMTKIAVKLFYNVYNIDVRSLPKNVNQSTGSFSTTELPLFKDGRPTNGRMVCKKQAFYSSPPQPKTANQAPPADLQPDQKKSSDFSKYSSQLPQVSMP